MKMNDTTSANPGDLKQSSRPRRTERAHRGKPDFYSPSDYENPFRRQRKRTVSSEGEQKKKKGRPKGSLKTLKFDIPKQDDESSREDDHSIDSPEVNKVNPPLKPVPTTPPTKVKETKFVSHAKEKNLKNIPRISTSKGEKNKTVSSKHLHLCSDIPHTNKVKEITLIKDRPKDDKGDGKEASSNSKQTDLYSALTPEKSLQCAIILAEINRKFACQNFKPV